MENANAKKPPQGRLGWIDRILLKIAVAGVIAGEHGDDISTVIREASRAFDAINQAGRLPS